MAYESRTLAAGTMCVPTSHLQFHTILIIIHHTGTLSQFITPVRNSSRLHVLAGEPRPGGQDLAQEMAGPNVLEWALTVNVHKEG